jgi:hypothetical protein
MVSIQLFRFGMTPRRQRGTSDGNGSVVNTNNSTAAANTTSTSAPTNATNTTTNSNANTTNNTTSNNNSNANGNVNRSNNDNSNGNVNTPWHQRRRVRWAAGGAVALGVIAATVAPSAIYIPRRNSSPKIASNSKIAAVSWLNAKNQTESAVIWQLDNNDLVAARWNGTGWKYTSISDNIKANGSPIYPRAGTYLGVTMTHEVYADSGPKGKGDRWGDIYFFSESDGKPFPQQIWAWWQQDEDGENYHMESLSSYRRIFEGGFSELTQMATIKDQCDSNCTHNSTMVYMNGDNKLWAATSSVPDGWCGWRTQNLDKTARLPDVSIGGPLALAHTAPVGAGADPSNLWLFYDVSKRLHVSKFDGSWNEGERYCLRSQVNRRMAYDHAQTLTLRSASETTSLLLMSQLRGISLLEEMP